MKDKLVTKSLHSSFPDWKTRNGGKEGMDILKTQRANLLPPETQGEAWTLGPRNGAIEQPSNRVHSSFDELEALRIKKFGAKVRLI